MGHRSDDGGCLCSGPSATYHRLTWLVCTLSVPGLKLSFLLVTTFCSIAHSLLLADILFLGTRVKLTMEVKAKRADN